MRGAIAAVLGLAALVAALAFLTPAGTPAAARVEPPGKASAGLVWHSGGLTLKLTDRPCPFEELAAELEAEGAPPARAYVVVQGGRQSTGCWVRDVGGDVLTRSPGGEEGTIPLTWFGREAAT